MATLRTTHRNITTYITSTNRIIPQPIHPRHLQTPRHLNIVKLGSSYSTETSPEMAAELRGKVDQMIEKNRAVIIGKSWCSFSRRATMALKPMAPDLATWDIDLTENESLIQDYLYRKTGQSTVPFVFINQQFIGGNSELQRIPPPQLKQLLNKKPQPSS